MKLVRFFPKFYNAKKTKELKLPEHFKHNLRNSTSAQIMLRHTMKQFRSQLPLLSLLEIAKASRAYVRAYYFIPNLLSPTDPSLEPGLRKHLMRDIVDPAVLLQKAYFEDRLFLLDKSLESRRNFLLAQETEAVEKALRMHKEAKRIENLKKLDASMYVSETEVEGFLDGEINTQIVKTDEHTVLSYKGVVKMTSLPGKMATFKDFTQQEIANYVCYNLQSTEQALQMFTNSLENPDFDANNRARMLQKIALLTPDTPYDPRLIDLIFSLEISQLSKKNICNTFWALGKIYRTLPKSMYPKYTSLQEKFLELLPISNSMNLAYACDGFKKLRNFSENLPEKIAHRFIELLDQIDLPAAPASFTIPYINIPVQGHSLFYGSTDLTIPTTKVPAYAMFRILHFLESSSATAELPYLYKTCAMVLNQVSMFELDKNLLVEALGIYGKLSEGLKLQSDIKDCILNMSQLVVKYYEELTVKQVCKIADALMGAGGFKYTSWFRLLELKAFEAIEAVEAEGDLETLLETAEVFTRYHLAVNYGRDIRLEPLVWINETFTLENPLMYKVYTIAKTRELQVGVRHKLAVVLGIIGYHVEVPKEMSILGIVAATAQRDEASRIEKLTLEEIVGLVNSTKDYNEVCTLAAALARQGTEIDWEYFHKFYENNKRFITSQPHRIALAWALKRKCSVEFEEKLLTVTEQQMLDQIKLFE